MADNAGHKIRSRQLIQALMQRFAVTVAGFVDEEPREPLRLFGRDVIAERAAIRVRRQPLKLARAALGSVLRREPYSIGKFANRRLVGRLLEYGRTDAPAVVVANLPMARYLDLFPSAVRLHDSHNIEAALWGGFVSGAPPLMRGFVRREARLLEVVERREWARAHGVIAICAQDAEVIGAQAPGTPVLVAPPALESKSTTPGKVGGRADVGMLGVWSWAPNEHALDVFASRMAPQLRRAGLSMRVTGPGVALKARRRLEALGVQVTGPVADIADFYSSVDQVVAPYFRGGGVRLKVLEAIAYAAPVVGTPLAFRGILGCESARDDICADPEALVSRLVRKRADIATARLQAMTLCLDVSARHDADRIASALNGFAPLERALAPGIPERAVEGRRIRA